MMINHLIHRLIVWLMWLPIDTAPRDGSIIDLWHKNGFRVTEVWWSDDCWSNAMDDKDFTHWSPVITPWGIISLAPEEEDHQ